MSKTENPYKSFSAPTLEASLDAAYHRLSLGSADPDAIYEMIDQMTEVLEARQKTDYCQHGVFLYGDYSPSCSKCEFGD